MDAYLPYRDPEQLKSLIAHLYTYVVSGRSAEKTGSLPLRREGKYRFMAAVLRAARELPGIRNVDGVRLPVSRLALAIAETVHRGKDVAFLVADFLLGEVDLSLPVDEDRRSVRERFDLAIDSRRVTELVEILELWK